MLKPFRRIMRAHAPIHLGFCLLVMGTVWMIVRYATGLAVHPGAAIAAALALFLLQRWQLRRERLPPEGG
jgi:hypothetical protein